MNSDYQMMKFKMLTFSFPVLLLISMLFWGTGGNLCISHPS